MIKKINEQRCKIDFKENDLSLMLAKISIVQIN